MSWVAFFRAFLAGALIASNEAFISSMPPRFRPFQTFSIWELTTPLNLFWFGKGEGEKENTGEGVAQVVDSMEGFKKSQEVGKLTSSLLQDLGSIIVEGSAAEGKVRVFMDGQQRPKRVKIDEVYGDAVDVDDLSTALVTAMQDAYGKSREKMEEKMKELYVELGLPPRATP